MTTFQAIIYGLIHGLSELLPIGRTAHEVIVSYLFHWQPAGNTLTGAFSLGTLFSILVYFRHDWASILSCFLQVCIFRKRPMTLDERLPIFLTITTLPVALSTYYLVPLISQLEWTPFHVGIALTAFSIPLWLADSTSRKNKGMFDWNWIDALTVGLTQALALLPGGGEMTGLILGALLRNYHLEAGAKYAFLAITPILASHAWTDLRGFSIHSATPTVGVTWLTFNLSLIITFFAGLLAIGGFMRQIQKKTLKPYLFYRWFLAGTLALVYWIRNKS